MAWNGPYKESGGPYILSESGAIATGSLPQFFKRKMYYSCRRIHTLLSAAFHGLHIQQFIVETCENSYEEISNALEEWNNQKKLEIKNALLVKIVDQYKTFKDETLAGRKVRLLNFGCNTAKL